MLHLRYCLLCDFLRWQQTIVVPNPMRAIVAMDTPVANSMLNVQAALTGQNRHILRSLEAVA